MPMEVRRQIALHNRPERALNGIHFGSNVSLYRKKINLPSRSQD